MNRQHSSVRAFAPAKVNLFLEILRKREDGFHEIETWMSAIGLYDCITLSLPLVNTAKNKATTTLRLIEQDVSCRWDVGYQARLNDRADTDFQAFGDAPEGMDNIAVKAVERLRERAGLETAPAIEIRKAIPSASGLGGASSDAASALMAANRLYRLNYSRDQLADIASEIGSDVPFFLGPAGSAICRGRGERITPAPAHAPLHLVLVRPPTGLSTPEVYGRLQVPSSPRTVDPFARSVQQANLYNICRGLHNRLEQAAQKISPWVDRLKSIFNQTGCWGHQMTGSGSVYFGVCRHARHARSVAGALRGKRIGEVYQTTTLTHLQSTC